MAISVAAVAVIKELAAKGLNHRDIAKVSGVSRYTVATVLSGEWEKRHEAWMARRQASRKHLMEVHTPGMYQRCPGCGGKVKMPCRACKMRERLILDD